MKKPTWSAKVVIRYALFQIPGLAGFIVILLLVQRWVNLPSWLFWGFIALWLIKDAVLFPFVWRAYDRDRSKELQTIVGGEGIVEERLAPTGYIRVHGELWQAEGVGADVSIERGETVRIRGIKGLRLQVERKNSLKV